MRIELLCGIYSLTAVFVFGEERGRSVCVQHWSTCDMFVFFFLFVSARERRGSGVQCEASYSRGRCWFSQPTEWLSDRDRENPEWRGSLRLRGLRQNVRRRGRTAALSTDVDHATVMRGRHPRTPLRQLSGEIRGGSERIPVILKDSLSDNLSASCCSSLVHQQISTRS